MHPGIVDTEVECKSKNVLRECYAIILCALNQNVLALGGCYHMMLCVNELTDMRYFYVLEFNDMQLIRNVLPQMMVQKSMFPNLRGFIRKMIGLKVQISKLQNTCNLLGMMRILLNFYSVTRIPPL